ncbi:MAG: nickel/cobalt transporter [Rhizobiaceae bacterium]|nr:nickel/cobalt transporter [Rhizobiaceae bacterium]
MAQSSLGIGNNEATVPTTGLFAGWLNWINVQQQGFYRSLTEALKTMRDGGSGIWLLLGLSFAYGVFHAAGPGHGKAVISSYMLANEVALRRGVMLSFVSAFLQAAVAIAVIGAVFLLLRGTSVSMTDATWYLEVASYALITGFGAWLLLQKGGRLLRRRPAHSLSAAATPAGASAVLVETRGSTSHAPGRWQKRAAAPGGFFAHGHEQHETSAEFCETCGRSHMPDPEMLSGDRFSWGTAWSAVAAIGIRPCSGALIVLTFAFLNGLWAGGILSVLAMALGTAITVSVLAILAVAAKNWAVTLAGDGSAGNRVHTGIEIGGAAMVFLLGLTLLAASLAA